MPASWSAEPLAGIAFQRGNWRRAFGRAKLSQRRAEDRGVSRPAGCRPNFGAVRPSRRASTTDLAACAARLAAGGAEATARLRTQIKGFDARRGCSPGWRDARRLHCASPAGVTCKSSNVGGLYPGGEGAGYAGGIMSDPPSTASAWPRRSPGRCSTSSEQPLPRSDAANPSRNHPLTPGQAYGARGCCGQSGALPATPRRARSPAAIADLRALFDWRCGVIRRRYRLCAGARRRRVHGLAELRATRAAGAHAGRSHRRAAKPAIACC